MMKKEYRHNRWPIALGVAAAVIIGVWVMLGLPGRSYKGPLPPLTAAESQSAKRLQQTVTHFADTIGERNIWHDKALTRAADSIKKQFQSFGLQVSTQPYRSHKKMVMNIIGEKKGTATPEKIIIIGAHYDSVFGSPGANDNATGVAAMLELARTFQNKTFKNTLRFVAFVNEEPPFFLTKHMGSLRYAKRVKARKENIIAMFSLETLGHYDDTPYSQRYPFLFNLLYPNKANFVGVVSNFASYPLLRKTLSTFRRTTKFPSEGVAAPAWIVGIAWSDHWAFWRQGYPALMITDTALFRDKNYHSPQDTSEKIDYQRLARVVGGLQHVVTELANAK